MDEPDNGRQSAQGEGIAQAYGPGARASVEIHHHHPAPTAASFRWPRPWDFSGYIGEKRWGFTGRDWLFDKVRGWYADRDGAPALLLCADFGVGKSAFMAQLAHNGHGLQLAACHFCDHYVNATLNPVEFVRSVAAQLADSLPDYREAVDADPDARRWLDDVQLDPASAFSRAVVGPLNRINAPAATQVLLVDALDEALDFKSTAATSNHATIARLLAGHARQLPSWLRVLATSRRIQEVLQPIQSAFRRATLDGDDARNLDDIYHYVTGRCVGAKLASVLEEGNRSAGEIAAFLSSAKQSGGKFLYAVRVLNDVESGGALSLGHLDDLPPGMDGFYVDAFERRFPESEEYGPVGALLAVLSVEREPMSRTELSAILCAPEKQVGKMLRRLDDFLRVGDKRYAFDHLSLSQWLSAENGDNGFERAGRFSVELPAAETQIADWARRELAADRVHESAYLARHLGAYLSPRERKIHLAKLLLDFRWLDARLRAAVVNALLADWAHTYETPSLKALERALRHSAYVLGREGSDWSGADFLASEILGRLRAKNEPELKALCAQAADSIECDAGWSPLTDSLRSTEALLCSLEGHTNSVFALAKLADGRLASASRDKTIRLWNVASGMCEATLNGHKNAVTALVVLADGRLASGSRDKTIKLWNLESGKCEATFTGLPKRMYTLAVLGDGRLASASEDNAIKLWNPATGLCEAKLDGHSQSITALLVLADGRIASGSWDDTIRLWNPASGTCEAVLKGHSQPVSALAVLPDGRLVSGSWDSTIKLWNPSTGACEATLVGHQRNVTALAVLPDGRLVSGSEDDTIRLWKPVSLECEATLEGHMRLVTSLAVLADGQFASGSQDHTIKLWRAASDTWETTLDGHKKAVTSLAVLADGRLASGSRDLTIMLWSPANGVREATLRGHTNAVSALAALPDGRLASGSWDCTIGLWDPASRMREATLEGHTKAISALAVLADGRLASGSEDWTIRLWNPASGACEATLEGHLSLVSALASLPDGRLVSGSGDNRIKLWNPTSGVCLGTLKGHTDMVSAVTALAEGRLASAASDNTIKLWNLSSGACEMTLEGHKGVVTALSVLSDGQLATASLDKTIRVWQMRNGSCSAAVRFVADAAIWSLEFVAGAGVLVAGDAIGRVHFLKVGPAQTPPVFDLPRSESVWRLR